MTSPLNAPVEGGTVDLKEAFGLSDFELRAYLHGAALGRIAAMRGRHANRCVRCGLVIDPETPWTVEFPDGSLRLKGLVSGTSPAHSGRPLHSRGYTPDVGLAGHQAAHSIP